QPVVRFALCFLALPDAAVFRCFRPKLDSYNPVGLNKTRNRPCFRKESLMNYVFFPAIGTGIVAGLRSLLPPAVVAWAAHFGWLNLHGSPLAFMGSTAAVAIFSIFAIGELISDKLPMTPKRTALAPLLARILLGGLSGACLFAAAGKSLPVG